MVMWDLERIYPFSETVKRKEHVQELARQFFRHKDSLSDDITPEQFLSILKEQEHLLNELSLLDVYAGLWLTENTVDQKRLAHHALIDQLSADISNQVIFFSLWFKELPEEKAKELIDAAEKYRHVLELLRIAKQYTLSEEEERIITLKNLTGDNALVKLYDLITGKFLYDWDGKQEPLERITKFFVHQDRELRKKAYTLVLSRYAQEQDALGELYKNIANDDLNENKLRGYASSLVARNLGNDVPDKAVDALLAVVKKNVPLFQHYFTLKKKICKLQGDRFDVPAPYPFKEKTYPYEDAKRIVLDSFREFSPDAEAMASTVFNGYVYADVVPNKRTGAFCWGYLPGRTPYVMLNHAGTLRDVSVMVHEMGHAIHGIAANGQSSLTYHATLPLAETASVFAEMLLHDKLSMHAGKEEKTYLLIKLIDNCYSTIVRQAYFTLFELQAYAVIGKGATIDDLNAAYLANIKEQFGAVITVPDLFQHEWKYVPHLFHTPYYCYAYAFGNLLVLALYERYKKEGKAFVPKYFKLLAAGGSESPEKLLKELGFDITSEQFWQDGFDVIKRYVDQLEK